MGRRADRRRANAQDFSFEEKLTNEMEYEAEDDEFSKKKKLIIIAVCAIVLVIAIILICIAVNCEKDEPVMEEQKVETSKTLEDTYEGFKVLGKIIIDDLNVEQYILDSTSDKALEKGVIKLNGGTLNNYGNFCIAGHNQENVFAKLDELDIGDKFKIVDKKLDETVYIIKETYTVEPDDLKCLLQNEEKVEITLITCENGATTRRIIKAEEYNTNITTEENANNADKDAEENG